MIRVGADYYPEHWDPAWWEDDIKEMARVGVNTVRIAEFSWGALEPEDGTFCFDWLDRAIALFDQYGIDVILGTPTNCAPVWLYTRHPETRQAERDGRRAALGIRGHRCVTNSTFLRYAARIVEQMAKRYAGHPRVIAWQLDNEPEGNHCCCPSCTAHFRSHLKERYKTIAALNSAWGNDVWSGQFDSFSSINPPLGAAYQYGWLNPAYLLDYELFAARSTEDYLRFQRDIIRRYDPNAVITTNACFQPNQPDFHTIFSELDVASYDNYPEVRPPQDEQTPLSQAFALDLARGYLRKNFWIVEQLSGPKGCWIPMSPTPLPGMLKGYAWQTIARGANLLLFFRWRTAQSGAEMFWHGLMEQRLPGGRRYEEFCSFLRELKQTDLPPDARVNSRVAILYSYAQERAFRIQPQYDGFGYAEHLKLWHDGFVANGVNVDVIDEHASLEGYDVVVAPMLFLTDAQTVSALTAFSQAGGALVLTNRTGVKTPQNNRVTDPLPGAFSALCGCVVSEYDPIGTLKQRVSLQSGESYEISRWCDLLSPAGAEVLARYADSFYAGTAAVTKNRVGNGVCYYVGFIGERAFYRDMAARLLAEANIPFAANLPAGVELATRETQDTCWTFVFNNAPESQSILLAGEQLTLKPYETRVFKRALLTVKKPVF